MKRTQPIRSSIHIDELLNDYLPRAGRRKFEKVELSALKQCARYALHAVIENYGLQGLPKLELWDRISRGAPYDHILLLPDDANGHAAGNASPGAVVAYFNGVENPRALLRITFFHTVVREECQRENTQRRIRKDFADSIAPAQHRSNGKGGHAPIQDVAVAEFDALFSEEIVQATVERVLSKMRKDHAQVIKLLLGETSAVNIAEQMNMCVQNVYAIAHKFRSAYRKAIAKLEHSRCVVLRH
jgi:DNA-directed RNA polymerase specialized sigma24 family protein